MQSNKTTASLLQPDLFPDFRTASFSPPKHSRDLCIPQRKWEFLCHTLYLGKYPFLLGPKGCGKSSVAMELADAMEMDYFGFDMGHWCAQQGKRVCDRMIPFQFFVFRVANIVLFLGFAK